MSLAVSGARFRTQRFSCTTTDRQTVQWRSLVQRAPWSGWSRCLARAMWCAACSPTSRPTFTSWLTATTLTIQAGPRKSVDLLISRSLDMVNAARASEIKEAYRRGHRIGNVVLTCLVTIAFGKRLTDLLSGYRVFSRRFVKSFPALATGFEIETELSIHALQLRMPIAELTVSYKERPQGSTSKLNTYTDGLKILRTIVFFVKEEKPFAFFSFIAGTIALVSSGLGAPVVIEFMRTGLVPRIPTALLAAALMILSFLAFTCGLILDTVSRGRLEVKRLWYLSVPVRYNSVRRSGER